MFRKAVYTTIGLMAAAGGPVAYFSAPDYWQAVRQRWLPSDGATAAIHDPAAASSRGLAEAGYPPSEIPLEGAPVGDLAEVLRFDVNPGWILQRWPRVSTGLAGLQLQGYRVPLVTGIEESDLAGSLTYYFNPQQTVERITFRGTTGDARKLVGLLTTRYHFTRRLTNSPALFVYESVHRDGRRAGVMKITSADVVKSSDPNRRFAVDLAMERPGR